MTTYCLIDKENLTVLDGPKSLPKSWISPNGAFSSSGLGKSSTEELAALGWVPYVIDDNGFDPALHFDGGYLNTVTLADVTAIRQYTIKTEEQIADETAATLTATTSSKIAAIKTEANRRIIAIVPEWKQRNLTARGLELLKKGEANWTQDEADEYAAGEIIWAQVKAIRAASDTLEASLDSLTATEIAAIDPASDTNWL